MGWLVQRRLLIRIALYKIQKRVRKEKKQPWEADKGGFSIVRPGGSTFPHACQSLSKFRIDEAHRQHC